MARCSTPGCVLTKFHLGNHTMELTCTTRSNDDVNVRSGQYIFLYSVHVFDGRRQKLQVFYKHGYTHANLRGRVFCRWDGKDTMHKSLNDAVFEYARSQSLSLVSRSNMLCINACPTEKPVLISKLIATGTFAEYIRHNIIEPDSQEFSELLLNIGNEVVLQPILSDSATELQQCDESVIQEEVEEETIQGLFAKACLREKERHDGHILVMSGLLTKQIIDELINVGFQEGDICVCSNSINDRTELDTIGMFFKNVHLIQADMARTVSKNAWLGVWYNDISCFRFLSNSLVASVYTDGNV